MTVRIVPLVASQNPNVSGCSEGSEGDDRNRTGGTFRSSTAGTPGSNPGSGTQESPANGQVSRGSLVQVRTDSEGLGLDRAGDFRPVSPKHCACGAQGEWPGRECPECRPVVTPDMVREFDRAAEAAWRERERKRLEGSHRARVRKARLLRSEGLRLVEVGERLGVTASTVIP